MADCVPVTPSARTPIRAYNRSTGVRAAPDEEKAQLGKLTPKEMSEQGGNSYQWQHLRAAMTSVSGKTSTICTQAKAKCPSSPSHPGTAPLLGKEAGADQARRTLQGDRASSGPTFRTSAPTTWEQFLPPPEPVTVMQQRTSPSCTWL